MREVTLNSTEGGDAPLCTSKVLLCAGDIRKELKRLISATSPKSARDIRMQLEIAYYKAVLRLFENLPANQPLYAGYQTWRYSPSGRNAVLEINEMLDYLVPLSRNMDTWTRTPSVPLSDLFRPRNKRGRRATRKPVAVPALQMRIENKKWPAITKELCDCNKSPHDGECMERIRQSVMGLEKRLSRWG